jgi:hypothetical protein
VLTDTPAVGIADERGERMDEDEPSGSEGDPPDPLPAAARAIACTVWFGPNVPPAAERELLAMLGSHNGVGVLQWPRDRDRAQRCWERGIPTMCFVRDQVESPTQPEGLVECLPASASEEEVHDSLNRLSRNGATLRQAALPTFDQGCLHLGACAIPLDPSACDLAAVLVAHFDQAVDDSLLSSACRERESGHRSLLHDLLRLDRDLNQLGLEVVPVNNHEHAIRRCAT